MAGLAGQKPHCLGPRPAWAKEGFKPGAGRGEPLQGVPAGRALALGPWRGAGAEQDHPHPTRGVDLIGGAVFGEMPGLMGRADPERGLKAGRQPP